MHCSTASLYDITALHHGTTPLHLCDACTTATASLHYITAPLYITACTTATASLVHSTTACIYRRPVHVTSKQQFIALHHCMHCSTASLYDITALHHGTSPLHYCHCITPLHALLPLHHSTALHCSTVSFHCITPLHHGTTPLHSCHCTTAFCHGTTATASLHCMHCSTASLHYIVVRLMSPARTHASATSLVTGTSRASERVSE
jgi:hypothetical protein